MSQSAPGIEIKNFDNSKAKNSFKGNFDLIIRGWGLILHGCSLFANDKGQWIKLPQRSSKNDQGQYEYSPHVSFVNPALFKRLETASLEIINKMDAQPAPVQQPVTHYPHGIIKPGQVAPAQQNQYEDQGLPF